MTPGSPTPAITRAAIDWIGAMSVTTRGAAAAAANGRPSARAQRTARIIERLPCLGAGMALVGGGRRD